MTQKTINFPWSILKDHRNDNKTLLLRSVEALHHHIFSMVYSMQIIFSQTKVLEQLARKKNFDTVTQLQ